MRTLTLFALAALAGGLGIYFGVWAIRLRLLPLLIMAALILFVCAVLIRAGIGFTD